MGNPIEGNPGQLGRRGFLKLGTGLGGLVVFSGAIDSEFTDNQIHSLSKDDVQQKLPIENLKTRRSIVHIVATLGATVFVACSCKLFIDNKKIENDVSTPSTSPTTLIPPTTLTSPATPAR